MNKKIKIVLLSVLAIILIAIIVLLCTTFRQIQTISSIEEIVPNEFYVMDYKANYDLETLISQNHEDDVAFAKAAAKQIFPYIPSNIIDNMTENLKPGSSMCSVFETVDVNGDNLFGRNYDFQDNKAFLLRTSPKDGYKSISMIDTAFMIGNADGEPLSSMDKMILLLTPYAPIDGINEKGLGAALLLVPDKPTFQNTGKTRITTSTMLRLILDKAATVDEAIALMEQFDMRDSGWAGVHFFITDATGKSVVVEYPDNVLTVTESNICTNFYLAEEYDTAPDLSRAHERFNTVDAMLQTSEDITSEYCMKILDVVHMNELVHDMPFVTKWSCVYNLDNTSIEVAIDMNYDDVYEFTID